MKQQRMELSPNLEKTELNWLDHCRGEALPYRSDFNAIDDDYQFVLEYGDDDRIRLRHVGLFVEALLGTSLAGREFPTLFAQPHRKNVELHLQNMFHNPSKLFLDSFSKAGDIQFGLFPFTADYGPLKYAIGATSLDKVPVCNVPSLGVQNIEVIQLAEEKPAKKYGFAEERAGFSGAPARAGFQVIEGGGAGAPLGRPGLKVIDNVKREP